MLLNEREEINMNKIKTFMNKPMTWGGYFKMCGVCAGLSALTTAGMYAYFAYETKKSYRDAVERTKFFVENMENESNEENES